MTQLHICDDAQEQCKTCCGRPDLYNGTFAAHGVPVIVDPDQIVQAQHFAEAARMFAVSFDDLSRAVGAMGDVRDLDEISADFRASLERLIAPPRLTIWQRFVRRVRRLVRQ